MFIDFKTTIWDRIYINDTVPQSIKEQLIKLVKDKEIIDANQCYGFYPDIDDSYELLNDTQEPMSLEDNDGCNTVELYDDNNNLIWGNGDKQ